MYIKWQYKWFGNNFFFNSPLELTFWITYITDNCLSWLRKSEAVLQVS
jgi:hypothetical protein